MWAFVTRRAVFFGAAACGPTGSITLGPDWPVALGPGGAIRLSPDGPVACGTTGSITLGPDRATTRHLTWLVVLILIRICDPWPGGEDAPMLLQLAVEAAAHPLLALAWLRFDSRLADRLAPGQGTRLVHAPLDEDTLFALFLDWHTGGIQSDHFPPPGHCHRR